MIKTGFKILIVGDAMLDEYIIGDHTRTSPEADVPVISLRRKEVRLGGAANVAKNLISLKSEAFLVSVTGDDISANTIQDICTYSGIQTRFIVDKNRPTTKKTRIINAEYKQYLRLDEESTKALENDIFNKLKSELNHLLNSNVFDAIIIQDYDKGCISLSLIEELKQHSRSGNIPLFVDPKIKHFKELSDSAVFKPNLNELSAACGQNISPDISEINSAVTKLSLSENAIIFVSLADKGIYYRHKDVSGIIPGHVVNNADVSGAGDTVLCALAIGYLNGISAEKMAQLANFCGAFVCKQKGIAQIPHSDFVKMAEMLDL